MGEGIYKRGVGGKHIRGKHIRENRSGEMHIKEKHIKEKHIGESTSFVTNITKSTVNGPSEGVERAISALPRVIYESSLRWMYTMG